MVEYILMVFWIVSAPNPQVSQSAIISSPAMAMQEFMSEKKCLAAGSHLPKGMSFVCVPK